jgi:hypothetical protein
VLSVEWMGSLGWTGQEGALEAELAYMEKQSRPLDSVVCDSVERMDWTRGRFELERDRPQSSLVQQSQTQSVLLGTKQ